jgi:hypothetical protein
MVMHLGAPFSVLRKRQEASTPREAIAFAADSKVSIGAGLAAQALIEPASASEGNGSPIKASQLDLKVRTSHKRILKVLTGLRQAVFLAYF